MVCPTCGTSWPRGTDACPADGAALIAAKGAPVGDDLPLPEGTMVGEYQIEAMLGAGGMGEVYSARHPMIGKQVAIKVMNRACSANPVNVDRFVQEAQAVNAIGHANIVDIFSFGKTRDGRCFFVMEKLRGESLRARLDKAPMSLAAACDILEPVLRALEAAHVTKIIHRDLKPDNIFLVAARDGEPERVKLLDFGIAKLSGAGQGSAPTKTDTGTVVGTPSYMAPEQAAGSGVEIASDIYSLGVVFFEMATGQLPFMAASTVQIMAMHVCDDPPKPSSLRPVPVEVDALIGKMLMKRPIDRPIAAEIRAQLATIRAAALEVMGKATAPMAAMPAMPAMSRSAATVELAPTPPPVVATAVTAPAMPAPPVSRPVELRPRPAKVALPEPTGVVAPARATHRTTIAIIAIVAVVGGLAAWQLQRSPKPPAPASAPPLASAPAPIAAPPSPAVPTKPGILVLEVKPADAKVELANAAIRLDHGHLERTLAAGRYTLVVSHAGYEPATRALAVEPGLTASITVALVKLAPAITRPLGLPVKVELAPPPPPKKQPIDVDATHDPFAEKP